MSADNWTDCPRCKLKDSFREDYEIGTLNGEFYAHYCGRCRGDGEVKGCDFMFEHHVTQDLKAQK